MIDMKSMLNIQLLFLGFLFIFITACTEFDTNEESGITPREYPDQESWDAEMFFTKEGKRTAVLKAGYIAKYTRKKYTLLKDSVKVDFYDEQGKHKSVLTAARGKVFDDREDMVATGNVILVSDNGITLYSEELIWNNKEQKIISNVPVKITTESETMYGDSLRSDPDLINPEIINVHGSSKKKISINE
jgi:LPS export ABC transporter protein LptC